MQISPGKRSLPDYVWLLLVAVVYFLAARGGLKLASLHENVSPVWPATGVAIAALIYSRCRWWPGILLGAFAANALTQIPWWTALGIGTGNTLEAVLGAVLFIQVQERAPWLGKFSEGAGFLVASLSAPVVSAAMGVGMLFAAGLVPGEAVSELLLTWWAGDALGALVVTPALLTFCIPGRFERGALPRLCLLGLLVMAVCGWIMSEGFEGFQIFLTFPLLLLATWWFGGRGAKFATVLLVGFTVVVMATGDRHLMAPTLNQSLLLLELYLFSLALTGLLLAAFHQTGLLLLPGLVMVFGWLISGLLFASLEKERLRLDAFRFDTLVHDSEELVRARLETYIDALRGGASFFAASEVVSRGEWNTYVNSLEINRRHPGINGVGMVTPLRSYEVADFVARVRADGAPDFDIHAVPDEPLPAGDPAGTRHYAITYIEPQDINHKAIGLDLNSEPSRSAAARKARDTGRPTITDRIVLVQDGKQRPGFLLYYPFYELNRPLDTVDERRAAFRGWIYAPFITENFLNAVLGPRGRQVSIHVYEGLSPEPAALVYASDHAEDHTGSEEHFDRLTTVRLADKDYTIGWHHGPEFQRGETVPAMIAGSSLALVSALLAGLVLTLQTLGRRAGEIAEARTRELRELNTKLEAEVAERTRAESEARAARQLAEAANSAKSDFLATMSHEIRTPMNSVIGYTDLLLNSPVNDEQRIWLGNIQTSGRALLVLINDILDFSKIEAGKLELESIPFSPLGVAREVAGLLAPKADESKLRLVVEVGNQIPGLVVGDPSRLRQVLTNLVSNAVKFTESGTVRIGLDWQTESAARGRLSVVVQDTGIGIPEHKLRLLFTKFTQADSSTTRRYGGTGLGLAICKELVGLMGGEIAAHSVAGQGTRIGFEIPFDVAEPTGEPAPKAEPAPAPRPQPDIRVLLAEDAVMNQRLAVAVLRRLGCEVDLAVNGREAVEKFKDCRYDIVYMDCQMPEMDGFAATRQIRRVETSRGERTPVPIVAVTANALQGDREKCLEAGMDDYITKPFTIADIARTLEVWVARRGE